MMPKLHVALNVNHLEESLAFYRAMLGLEPVKVRRGYAKFDSAEPGVNLTLNERRVSELGGINHLGIQVGSTEEVLKMRERWQAGGLVTEDEMQTNCCYAIQDKVWVTDPNGYRWEAFVVLEDQLPEVHGQAASACCASDAGPQLVKLGGAWAAK
jgi:catechol 2,3-dioxygenase-like lactoylglutathione lyase family enzyme